MRFFLSFKMCVLQRLSVQGLRGMSGSWLIAIWVDLCCNCTRLTNGTGFFMFRGNKRKDVPSWSQDKGTGSKYCHRTCRDRILTTCPVPSRPFSDNYQSGSDFVLGCPGTDNFVQGFLVLPLSWDKGIAGQDFKIFLSWSKGTTGQDVPLETLNCSVSMAILLEML